MSESLSPKSTSTEISPRPWKVIVGILITIILLAFLKADLEQLLLGWLYFPLRTIPKMTIDWPSAIFGIVCVFMFVIGLHRTARGVMKLSSGVEAAWTTRWTWRITLVTSAILFVLFASGTAIVGAAHQAIWLLSGRHDSASEAVSPGELGLFASVRDKARKVQVRNNLKQFALAFHNFHDTYGAFPPGGTMNSYGELLHGWAMFVGPFHSYTAPDIDFSRGWRIPPNDRIYRCQSHDFLNASQPGPVFDAEGFGLCHWAGNVRVLPIKTVLTYTSSGSEGRKVDVDQLNGRGLGISMDQIKDGTSTTILLGTVGTDFMPWGHPANVRDPALGINRSRKGFGGPPGWNGGMFAMCDGSVGFLSEETDLMIMKALATPAGGEAIPDGFSFEPRSTY